MLAGNHATGGAAIVLAALAEHIYASSDVQQRVVDFRHNPLGHCAAWCEPSLESMCMLPVVVVNCPVFDLVAADECLFLFYARPQFRQCASQEASFLAREFLIPGSAS